MAPPRKTKPIKLLRKRLDDAGVAAHFDALASEAEQIEIRVRGSELESSSEAPAELDDARRQLLSGEVQAVQIRFFQDETWWCDTVMRLRGGYRLVRMRQDLPQ